MRGDADWPAWRSLLYVPATNERFARKAAESGADAVILDLEDSVPPAEKPRARALLAAHAALARAGGADIVVRLNRPWRQAIADLEAAVIPGVSALKLPKVESAAHVAAIGEVVEELEAERGLPKGAIRFIPMIETARGFFEAPAIAAAHPRNVALALGVEDFSASLGMEPHFEGLLYPKQWVAIAARAAGLMPLGFIGTVAEFQDLEALGETLRRSRRLGFVAAAAIHPVQIPLINREYGPKPEEISRAERLIAAYEAAEREGIGAIRFEGKMIDVPVVERARAFLRRARALAEKGRGGG
jgi:citrate lyase subunit beta/citryl-CoA lyase